MTAGGCSAGFIKAVSAVVRFPYCSSQTTLLLLAVEECPLSFLFSFRQCLKFSFPTDFFSSSDFLLQEGKPQAA